MPTSNRFAFLLALTLATASATASAGTMASAGGYQTPPTIAVIEDGFDSGSLLTPRAANPSFNQQIEHVRDGLRVAAADAQCAPAASELRLQRRLRRLLAVLGGVLRADASSDTRERLDRAAELHRSYCAGVRADASLRADCAAQLLLPCPKLVVEQ